MTESISDKAAALFLKTPKEYNCAQAVAKAFGHDELLEQLKSCGGGRAPDGICGALHAALVMSHESQREKVKQLFQNVVGNVHCRDIRREEIAPCVECVRHAAGILDEQLKSS